jgi:hypothetical protein
MTSDEKRETLARDQAALLLQLHRLGATEPMPGDHGPEKGLRVAGLILRKKRIRALVQAWPELPVMVGPEWSALLSSYLDQSPGLPRGQDGLRDGACFIDWLEASRNSGQAVGAWTHQPNRPLWVLRAALVLANRSWAMRIGRDSFGPYLLTSCNRHLRIWRLPGWNS